MPEENHYALNEDKLLVFEDREQSPHKKIFILFEVFKTKEKPPRTLTNRMFHGGDFQGIKKHAEKQAPLFPETQFEIFEAYPADLEHINFILNASALTRQNITSRLGKPVWTATDPDLKEETLVEV